MNVIRDLRRSAGVTQVELATRAGTSQPTVAAYEAGSKSPTLRTMERLAAAVGRSIVVSFVPSLTREDRRSLFLHRAIADVLRRDPEAVLERARRNLDRMRIQHPAATPLIEEWDRVLCRPIAAILQVMVDPQAYARDLRQVTPFAGVLAAPERARVYREFAELDASR